ncbi:hypothetical protein AZI85_08540 [Bdellovibrio bacteriovorus]|uniref:IPT/TIG domain-containing protein n=1 Tax=Bdellovibrio bacteriovorus TaxID=959 RepID=A0A150WDJ9_BDEBC|nr:IPT/TIG domain-containing protein [Bdellovibrio bacteriovorus]KYG60999.1 hypothetical protein AZI85_08540 [Bdellovibrio bacteriovorus]
MKNLFKNLITVLVILISFSANAKDIKELQKFSRKVKLIQSAQSKIGKISFSNSNPIQGDRITAFIELSTSFNGNAEISHIIDAEINGRKLKSHRKTDTLWVTEPFVLHKIGSHTLTSKLFLENKTEANLIRTSILAKSKDIERVVAKLARESDPVKRAALETERDALVTEKEGLENLLDASKRAVSTFEDIILVSENINSINYPKINLISPNVVSLVGGEEISITGVNLEKTERLWIGGVEISDSDFSIVGGMIVTTVPTLQKEGPVEVKIASTFEGQSVISDLPGGLFASSVPVGGPQNTIYPVAFAGTPQVGKSGDTITLDGSRSYSADGAAISYSWSVVSKPLGSTSLDGVFDDATLVHPQFIAHTPGNYTVALEVSNGSATSIPSLTLVTIGHKAEAYIAPTEIFGTAMKDGVYIGSFKICNNKTEDVNFQIFLDKKVTLLSGYSRGTLQKQKCGDYQFSVKLLGDSAISIDIPVWIGGITKILHLQVLEGATSPLKLETTFLDNSWSSESDLEVLSLNGHVPLFGSFDEISPTQIKISNTSNVDVEIFEPPTFTHLNGSSGVFSSNYPVEGLIVPANGSVLISLMVQPGVFANDDSASAIMEWIVEENSTPKVVFLKTRKLPVPLGYLKNVDLGEVETGDPVQESLVDIERDFFDGVFNGLTSVPSITVFDDAGGALTVDNYSYLPHTLLGNIGGYKLPSVQVGVNMSSQNFGLFSGKVDVKLKGYATSFRYNYQLEVAP